MRHNVGICLLSLTCLAVLAGLSHAAQEKADPPAPGPVVVLDTIGSWRMHHTLKPPLIDLGEGPQPVLVKQRWLNWETPEPPDDWPQPGFDDTTWVRSSAQTACATPYLSRLCLRGKFEVADPTTVKDLRLALGYHGGAIIYVNGKEVARKDIAKGESNLADAYPEEAFIDKDGKVLLRPIYTFNTKQVKKLNDDSARRAALRDRTFEDVTIPAKLLRKGVNVVAIEIVHSPYHKTLDSKRVVQKTPWHRGPTDLDINWDTCWINYVQLTAGSAEGLTPNFTRPPGLQAWNSPLLAADFDQDFGDPCEPLRPIALCGPRNGVYTGKVMVGSTQPIKGLKTSASDLKGRAGTIPASNIRVRYGMPYTSEAGAWGYGQKVQRYPRKAVFFGALVDSPPQEVAVVAPSPSKFDLKTPNQPKPVFGAVMPVWITVTVPEKTAAGTYTGQLAVVAEDQEPLKVPVRMEVINWTMPDTADYKTWIGMTQSPDTLALEYDVEPWSDEHFALIGKSMRLMGQAGCRIVYIHLICNTNYGNAESMVRWIPQDDGTFKYDFSVLERYLDLARKEMGTPKIVVFGAWDIYIGSKDKYDETTRNNEAAAIRRLKRDGALTEGGPRVSMLNPKTGKVETQALPAFTDPSSKKLWGPLFEQLRGKMKQRGLQDKMMLGYVSDAAPSKEEFEVFNEVAAGMPWVVQGHVGYASEKMKRTATVGYQTLVRGRLINFADRDEAGVRRYGWKMPRLLGEFSRGVGIGSTNTRWRHLSEINITGTQRGVGRLGVDYWRCIRDNRGRRRGFSWSRYPQSHWRSLNLYASLFAPGPDGPVSTTRYENFRAGVQECEARIFIEQALTDDALRTKLGDPLAERCQKLLDERVLYMFKGVSNHRLADVRHEFAPAWRFRVWPEGHFWFVGSGHQERSRQLFLLAAEVDDKLQQAR